MRWLAAFGVITALRWRLLPGHLAYFSSDLVGQLDPGQNESWYEREWRGYLPDHLVMMGKVLQLSWKAGLVMVGQVSRGGTKLKLNALKHGAGS